MRLRSLFSAAALVGLSACSSGGTAIAVPQGVSAHVVEDVAVVAVRDGDEVNMFLAGDRRQEVLQFCDRDQVFTTSEGGSWWSLDGIKGGGPSPSDLDRVSAKVQADGSVKVFIDVIAEAKDMSELQDSGTPFRPMLGPEWPERFKSPASFCPFS